MAWYDEKYYGSRKFLLALFSIVVMTGLTLLSVKYVMLAGVLATFIGGLIGILSVYYGGNVASSFVVNKATQIGSASKAITTKTPTKKRSARRAKWR